MSKQQVRLLGFTIASFLALLAYLPLRSLVWDLNGIIEALAVEEGGSALVSANHMLFRPLGYALYELAQSLGYSEKAAHFLQILTAVIAALGIGFTWIFTWNLAKNVIAASLATALLAVSWSYWAFSTDVYYITPAATAVAATIALLTSFDRITRYGVVLAGLLTAVSVLVWQANIFMIPFCAFYIYWVNGRTVVRTSVADVVLYGVVVMSAVGIVYLATAFIVLQVGSVDQLAQWLLSHGSQGGISWWGVWSLARVPAAIIGIVSSYVPVWEGLGLRDLLRGNFDARDLLGQLSVVALVMLVAISIVAVLRNRNTNKEHVAVLALMTIGYLLYLPFIIWWDPFQPGWFIVPNLFIVGILAIGWSRLVDKPMLLGGIAGLICIVAAANFTLTIWPRHTQENPDIALAQCVVANTTDKDGIVVTDWTWFGYALHFFDYRGSSISLVGDAREVPLKLLTLQEVHGALEDAGGHLYLKNFQSYVPDDVGLVTSLTGLTQSDFDLIEARDAFTCNGTNFQRVLEIRTIASN